jgi:hypothetical protein
LLLTRFCGRKVPLLDLWFAEMDQEGVDGICC